MKKKTINFYFFKKTLYQLTNIFSPISKNFIKQYKKRLKFIKIKKKTQLLKQKQKIKKTLLFYKRFVRAFIYVQWASRQNRINYLYLQSGFLKNKNKKKAKLLLFWRFKRKFYKNLTKQLINYPQTGIISSHLVHFLLRKNLTYQTRSKYRSILPNLPAISQHLYVHIKLIYNYVQSLNVQLFKITATTDNRVFILNEELNRVYTESFHISNKSSQQLGVFKAQKINWNCFTVHCLMYTYDDFKFLYKNKEFIFEYIANSEVVKNNKNFLFININTVEQKLNALPYFRMFKKEVKYSFNSLWIINFIFATKYYILYKQL